MTRHSNCCVHLGSNNFRNFPGLAFCKIPKARRIHREYVRLFRNANLKVNSDSTRICSAHWDGCDKQRSISSIFRWSKKKVNDELYAGRSQLRIQEPGKETLKFLVPKWTLWLVR